MNSSEENKYVKNIFRFAPDDPSRIITRESSQVEFKASFNWAAKSDYAKTMAAFANNKGGCIVFGVENKPRYLIGLKNNNLQDTDEARISGYLNSCFSPEIHYEKTIVKIKGKTIGIIETQRSSDKPIVSTKPDNAIKEAEIYYRYNARSERIKYPELMRLFQDSKEKERKGWMTLLSQIGKVGPMKSAVIDVEKRKVVNSDGEVFPATGIKITDEPGAPKVRLEITDQEFKKKWPWTYEKLTKELKKKFTSFKVNSDFHGFRRIIMKENMSMWQERYLDIEKQQGSSKVYYSPRIIKQFNKYYKKSPS